MARKGICNYNYTIIWPNYKYRGLANLNEEKQVLEGRFTNIVENLLGDKRCKMTGIDNFGTEYPNGTLTGALKKFYTKQGDFLFDLKSFYQNSSLVDFTYPVYHQTAVISHSLDLKDKKSEKNILELIDLDFYYVAVYTIIMSAVIFFFAWKLKWRFISYCEEMMSEQTTKCYEITRKYLSHKFTKYQIIAIFCVLLAAYYLLFFNQIFIINSFITSNVLVSTDQIIYDNKQLSLTKKNVWFFERAELRNLIMNSPSDTFLKKTLEKKSSNPIKALRSNLLGIKLKTIREFEKSGFLLALHLFSRITVSLFISQTRTFYWISNEFFAYSQCHLLRKSLPEKDKKFIKTYMLKVLEGGILIRLFRESITLSDSINTNSASNIYENSLDTIINENTKFISNAFKSFEALFVIYLTILISILILFVLVNSRAFLKFCFRKLILCYSTIMRKKMIVLRFVRECFMRLGRFIKCS